jgi:hypothetical protein
VNKGPAVDTRFTDFPFKPGVVNMNAAGNVKASATFGKAEFHRGSRSGTKGACCPGDNKKGCAAAIRHADPDPLP